MRQLTMDEIGSVSGGVADYQDIGVAVGLTGIAVGAFAVSLPVIAVFAAGGAIAVDAVALYNEF